MWIFDKKKVFSSLENLARNFNFPPAAYRIRWGYQTFSSSLNRSPALHTNTISVHCCTAVLIAMEILISRVSGPVNPPYLYPSGAWCSGCPRRCTCDPNTQPAHQPSSKAEHKPCFRSSKNTKAHMELSLTHHETPDIRHLPHHCTLFIHLCLCHVGTKSINRTQPWQLGFSGGQRESPQTAVLGGCAR